MRWWGWGEESSASAVELAPSALALLHSELGLDPARGRSQPPDLDRVELADSALSAAERDALVGAVGAEHLREDRLARVQHAAGRGYPDLVRLRDGRLGPAPDAVVAPADAAQVAAVLDVCSRLGVAVVPFGGGTSVVGGVTALRGAHPAAITLDLTRMDAVLDVDRVAGLARLQAGLMGPALERELGRTGMTLGHFPQSFEHSTLGGWVATRSAGQASTGYGRIDDLVESVRCQTPTGTLASLEVPSTAAGPDLRELVVGSEGTLGVITEATVRVRERPSRRHYEAWSFKSFGEGVEALRRVRQADVVPDTARLSDESETRLGLALAGVEKRAARLGLAYVRARGHEDGCFLITGFEGGEDVARRRGAVAERLRAAGGLALGTRPGRQWLRGRFEAPYLRDTLMDHGVMAETLETATTWGQVGALHATVTRAIGDALAERGSPALVMCHVSHLYRSGASLYFTFLARQETGAELDQWRAAKQAAGAAIVAGGATITHHHGVGVDHAPWMEPEIGRRGLDVLAAVKRELDPGAIMNPGKLLPER